MNLNALFNALIIQLFYAFGITLLVYSLPAGTGSYYDMWQGTAETIDLEGTSKNIEESIGNQLNVPSGLSAVDIGFLVLYSGNIFVDLMLNFFFAVPQLLNVILSGIFILIPFDSFIQTQIKVFVSVLVVSIYLIGIFATLVIIRSGGSVIA